MQIKKRFQINAHAYQAIKATGSSVNDGLQVTIQPMVKHGEAEIQYVIDYVWGTQCLYED